MAAVDYFLKIDGVDGESTDKVNKGFIDVESWSWGESNGSSHAVGAGSGAGKVSMQDFHFTMKMNKATPKLMLACATGQHIKAATLTCRRAGGKQEDFLKIKFENVLVSSYQTGGSAGASILPMDQISLSFSKIEFEYKAQKPDGSLDSPVKAGYNVKENVKV